MATSTVGDGLQCAAMQRLLATMVTTTSYGTWLPGDLRGYVDDGIILPSNPALLKHATSLMVASPVLFTGAEQQRLAESIITAGEQYGYRVLALSVESWHLHWLADHGFDSVPTIVGRLKTAMRKALARGRIWTVGYDARYCFTEAEVSARDAYINRHAGARSLSAVPGSVAGGDVRSPGRAGG